MNAPNEEATSGSGSGEPQARREEGRCELILVADEDEADRRVTARQLQRLGHEAVTVTQPFDVLGSWCLRPFAMLLIDCRMAALDGYELIRRLRAEDAGASRPSRPIIGMTPGSLDAAAHGCRTADIDACLGKPLGGCELRAALRQWLPGEAAAASDAPAYVQATQQADLRAALDVDVLRGLVGDDPELVAEILVEFAESMRETVPEIERALVDGDLRVASQLGHKLKSAARSVGALPLADVCSAIEEAGREPEAAVVEALHAALRARAAEVLVQLDGARGAGSTT